jgi:hypothetical protein
MKKFITAAVAAGALAAGGAASAQDFGSIIANIFGLGQPTYTQPNYGYGTYGGPAVVAPQAQIYADQYGRRFYYDQYGRQVYLSAAPQQQQQQQIIGYDSYGRPVYGSSSYAYGGTYNGYNSWDRDGDGIANTRDRWPDDRRYW